MHVVVLGAGYAGLALTRSLETRLPPDVTLTLVNESPDHLVQHELHRVIRRPKLAPELTVSLPATVDRATVRVGRVEDVDRDERVVALADGELAYDLAVVCLGADTAFYGLDGVRQHATPLKRLSDAFRIRRRAIDCCRSDTARIVVGGAGLSGIQVAGELVALLGEEGVSVGTDRSASVTIVEQAARVAPGFSADFQQAVSDALEARGVEVRTGATVAGADETAVLLESGDRLPCDQFVWTGGIRGPDAFDGDRPTVDSELRLDEHTFAIGDAARVVDADGDPVPASAQSAVREARTAAENIDRLVDARLDGARAADIEPELAQFSFDSPGWLVSVGDDAVAQVGPTVFTGRAATAMKTTVGVGYLSSIGAVRTAVERISREFAPESSD